MTSSIDSLLKLNQVVPMEIVSFNSSGDGIGESETSPLKFFVPNTVPGDRIKARITKLKRNFARAELIEVIEPSSRRIRPACIVADKCGGCQWMAVDYSLQIESKKEQVIQALKRIGGFDAPVVNDVLSAQQPLRYRNKVTYPLRWSADGRNVKAGYFQKGTHKLINLNQCPVQDESLNPLLAEVKLDIQDQEWSLYDEVHHKGCLRHVGFRVGRRTGEILITLVTHQTDLPNLDAVAQTWLERYPNVVGVVLNINAERTNRIFGSKTELVAGRSHLMEHFAGLQFQIQANTFFQVFTEQAEAILEKMIASLQLEGTETIVDAYCGVGSMTLPLAQKAEFVLGIEIQREAIRQAKRNAALNQIGNVKFENGKVEDVLSDMTLTPDILLLDPPRKGCDGVVLSSIRRLKPSRVLYLSCNPATLARDLKILCEQGLYHLEWVQPADFFPQTAHVEALALLHLA